MSAEQTPDIETGVALTEEEVDSLIEAVQDDHKQEVERPHALALAVESILADRLAAAVREARAAGWEKGYVDADYAYHARRAAPCEVETPNPYRADRVAEPQHEAATSSKESEASAVVYPGAFVQARHRDRLRRGGGR